MTAHHTGHGPLERTQPVDTELAALAVLTSIIDTTPTDQVIAILLDHDGIGHSILIVHETTQPDAILDVVDVLVASIPDEGSPVVSEVILASIRPGGVLESCDADRWFEASETFAAHGIELLEWFVMTDTVTCPRDLLGIPPRWHRHPTVPQEGRHQSA